MGLEEHLRIGLASFTDVSMDVIFTQILHRVTTWLPTSNKYLLLVSVLKMIHLARLILAEARFKLSS